MFIKTGVVAACLLVGSSLVGCSAPVDGTSDGTDAIQSRSAHFETFVGKDGKTYFDLVAGNGQNVLRSQGYASAAGAKKGTLSVIANGPDTTAFDVIEATDGTWYFNLTADNHEVIGTSEMYTTKSDATRGVSTVRALTLLLGENPEIASAVHQERFEVFAGEDKKFYFHLRAGNGEIVLASQGYTAKASAISGIKSVQTNGSSSARWSANEAIDGQYGIHLTAGNNQIIAQGELYSTKSNATAAVSNLVSMLSATNIPVVSE